MSISILAPVFNSFHRRKYQLISVLTNPCSSTVPDQGQQEVQTKTKGVQFHPSTEPSLSRPGAMHQFFNLLQYFSRFLYRFKFLKTLFQLQTTDIPIKENLHRNRFYVVTCCIASLSIVELQLQIMHEQTYKYRKY